MNIAESTAVRILLWVAVISWMRVIFYLSSIPGSDLAPPFPHFDKFAHFFEYLILALLIFGALRASSQTARTRLLFLTTILFSLCYAVSDENYQYFVPGRFPSFGDVIADLIGALVGTSFAAWMSQKMGLNGSLNGKREQ